MDQPICTVHTRLQALRLAGPGVKSLSIASSISVFGAQIHYIRTYGVYTTAVSTSSLPERLHFALSLCASVTSKHHSHCHATAPTLPGMLLGMLLVRTMQIHHKECTTCPQQRQDQPQTQQQSAHEATNPFHALQAGRRRVQPPQKHQQHVTAGR